MREGGGLGLQAEHTLLPKVLGHFNYLPIGESEQDYYLNISTNIDDNYIPIGPTHHTNRWRVEGKTKE